MKNTNFKQQLFEQFARIGKALSNGNRLEMLEFLAQGERSVESLAKVANLSVANASQHLQLLRQSGLVSSRKDGQKVFYSVSDDSVMELLDLLRKTAQNNLAEVNMIINTYLQTKDGLEPVHAEEVFKRAEAGLVTVIDVRPPEEFNSGHIPGAINIPLKDLESELGHLPKDGEFVAYCRGPYCVLAFDVVEKMRKEGFEVKRLEFGYPEWKRAGLPTVVES
jgi:rhodanese-related sulfurtransferase/DNA-binding transcriptional ArsR family regulator